MKKTMIATLLAFTFLTAPAHAAPEKYKFDMAHTQIHFSANHLGFSYPLGRFMKFDGGFVFDAEKPENSSVEAAIDTSSVFMGSEAWDAHMKNADFFNVEKFPKITFKSTRVTQSGDKAAVVDGDLTILGVTKPVSLTVTYVGSGVHPYNKNYISGFTAMTNIKRSDFGMTYGLPAIADDVEITLNVEGIRDPDIKTNQ